MSGLAKSEEFNNNSQFQKSKHGTNSQSTDPNQNFIVQMTVSQANAIMKLLPHRYSIQIDRTFKPKRIIKKKFTLENRSYKSIHEGSQDAEMNELAEKQVYGSIQTINYDEMTKKCQKILCMLRKNKYSWPFKEPVDPIAMGIPHYREIIKNPMDLKTIGQNLSSRKYLSMSQFYADISLIIENSYNFNRNNDQFYPITVEFEKYFNKVKADFIVATQPELPVLKKISSKPVALQKKESDSKSNELAKRKQVALKLKYLPREELTQLIRSMSVMGQSSMQLNLQTLPMEKIRFLQDYLEKKQNQSAQQEKSNRNADCESSFQSDSDS